MRGRFLLPPVLAGLVIVVVSGCAGGGPKRKVAVAKPGVALPGEEDTVVVTPRPQGVTFVDRHPLLSKPRHYYESTDNNKFVKTMAAGVVGVPAGIVGELKQIVVGRPAELR